MSLRFGGAFLFLILLPLLFALGGPVATLLAIVAVPLVLVGAEYLFPGREAGAENGSPVFRAIPVIYAVCQIATIVAACAIASLHETSWFGLVCLGLSTGVIAGIFGMLAAHELIHSRDRVERALGVVLLTAMSYRHFRIAHIHGHHRYPASDRDPTTARLGESYYAFFPRAVLGQIRDAWRHEEIRRRLRGASLFANRYIQDLLVMLAVYGAVGWLFGLRGVAFFTLESAVSISALELFNYVAHYGMVRRPGEPFTDRHSWNASHAVGCSLLFNMGRHSDHHRHASMSYQTLEKIPSGPELPAGYAGSMLLALIPPLWRKVMDRRLADHIAAPAE